MSTVKETLAMFEELDKKLDEIAVREAQLATAQRVATGMKDDAERKLAAVTAAQAKVDADLAKFRAESAKKDDEYKNREATLAAKHADLERKVAAHTDNCRKSMDEITKRTVALEKRESASLAGQQALAEIKSECTVMAANISGALSKIQNALSKL